jgi:hypothetical protein
MSKTIDWKTAYEGLMWQMRQQQADLEEAATERDLAWKVLLVIYHALKFTNLPREGIQAFVSRAFSHWNFEADPLWAEVLSEIAKEKERQQVPEGKTQ